MNDREWILIRGVCIIGILIAVNVIAVGLRIVVTVIAIAIVTAASNGRKESGYIHFEICPTGGNVIAVR